ncbi:MAG: hypothetical protein NC038_08335 [Paludibacter sp.]|nr:hypothetical protein [Bacteroidales bacterium]MCM1069688.1 hypothetical protein [Prevotella sp.]MCM1354404.1 hypothetical protein [Bacteroides sp.]MCM1441951.1 hypothetical protein [Muribaculum sp.]MCM1482625.1 hypothetical protein [Paludibacter sp.]
MKNVKLFAAALCLGAFALVGCNPDNGKTGGDDIIIGGGGNTETTQPEIDPIDGKVILAVHFLETPCNDVVLAGSYTWADGTTVANWDENYATFTAVEGAEGWYQVVIQAPAAGEFAYGKACQLAADGAFSWDYQWAKNSITVLDGLYEELKEENGGEQQFVFNAESTVVYAECKGWAMSPCVERELFASVTFNLTIPEAQEGGVYLHGPFVDDSWNGIEMTKVDDTHYTITVENLTEGTQYQYTLAADNWDAKGLFTVDGQCNADNRSVTAAIMNDEVNGFAADCEE